MMGESGLTGRTKQSFVGVRSEGGPSERGAPQRKHVFLIGVFLAAIFGVGLSQAAVELARGRWPGVLDLFRKAPSEANLRALEKQLDEACWLAPAVRRAVQLAQFVVLADCGEKAVAGRNGWLFYRPEVQYLVERWPAPGGPAADPGDPLAAIVDFRDQLASRGIKLLVVPAPNKASVYPEMLCAGAGSAGRPVNPATRKILSELARAGIEVVDLFEVFARAKAEGGSAGSAPLYLAQDTHWSPDGMRLAAEAVAERLLERGWIERGKVPYEVKPVPISRRGDVLAMIRNPWIERLFPAEEMVCAQVVSADRREPYRDDPGSPVLVLGDSFLRIYQGDEPGSAGFIAHLAREIGLPVASLVNDGGASTLVRQELYRRPELLAGKRVVVWEFVERDLRFGTEGWQKIPLR